MNVKGPPAGLFLWDFHVFHPFRPFKRCHLFPVGTEKQTQQEADDAENQRSDECPAEAGDVESPDEMGSQVKEEGVDDQGEETQGDNRNRQGQEDEDRSEESIQEPKHDSSHKDGHPVVKGHTRNNVDNDE